MTSGDRTIANTSATDTSGSSLRRVNSLRRSAYSVMPASANGKRTNTARVSASHPSSAPAATPQLTDDPRRARVLAALNESVRKAQIRDLVVEVRLEAGRQQGGVHEREQRCGDRGEAEGAHQPSSSLRTGTRWDWMRPCAFLHSAGARDDR